MPSWSHPVQDPVPRRGAGVRRAARLARVALGCVVALALSAHAAGAQQQESPGEALVRAMHDRYAATRWRTLTFVQTTERPDRPTATWYEALAPGRLRIDIAPLDSMNAVIFRNDSLYVFRAGQPVGGRAYFHPLLALLDDVYYDDPATTVARLRDHGFDLDLAHDATWQGRPVTVVGAAAGDTTSDQFWVDAERLITLRVIQTSTDDDGTHREDTWVTRHRRMDGGWVETEVLFHRDGVLAQREKYDDVHVGTELDPDLFDPTTYRAPGWVHR